MLVIYIYIYIYIYNLNVIWSTAKKNVLGKADSKEKRKIGIEVKI